MTYIIAALATLFVVLLVYVLRAKKDDLVFTDEQLLNQHCRFLEELESARRYLSGNYFHQKERGSPAEHELARRGYDVRKLVAERFAAEREGRAVNWGACRRAPSPRKG